MKKFRILMGALALAMVAATVIACNKEKEMNAAQQATDTEEVVRKPIASYDISSGVMHNYFDFDYANSIINENYNTKETTYRFIVESVEIIDSIPLNNDSEIIRKIVILDTEEENTITCWCIGTFVDKEIYADTVLYYVNEEVATGVYEFFMSSDDAVYVVHVNGSTYTFVEVEQVPETAMGKTIVFCLGIDCQSGCDLTSNNNCSMCISNPGQQGHCIRFTTNNVIIGQILQNILEALK
jgi:hypothetical protein